MDAFESLRSHERFAAYLRSALIHGIAIRLKQAFVLHGRGDERQVPVHAKLPTQFNVDTDVITVAENGAHGDGTARMFVENLERTLGDWSRGALAECPNAREDALIKEAFRRTDPHAAWRAMDPRDPHRMAGLAANLGIDPVLPKRDQCKVSCDCLRFGIGRIGTSGLLPSAYRDTHCRSQSQGEHARESSQWELVSTTVRAAADNDSATPRLATLLEAYQGLEDATLEESFGAEARLADQVYRLSARLCVDGCQGCLHTGSDLMPEALAESSVSRRLLERFAGDL